MAFGRKTCGQCGKRTFNGSFGDPGSDFEGEWFCQGCWDAWGAEGEEPVPAELFSERQAFHGGRREAEGRPAAQRFSERRAFGWGPQEAGAAAAAGPRGPACAARAAAPAAPGAWRDGTEAELARSRQAFGVLEKCPVRELPDLESRKLGTKSKGGNVWGGEITLDGWLKLHGERGWILTDMRGIDGVEAVLEWQPSEGAHVAIEGYHSQGICCLEVCFVQVAVREFPSREAPQLSLRYQGELVFARSQSFNGWVHLAGEPGWMLVVAEDSASDYGRLLMPLYNLPHVDLWLLRDVWASARNEDGELDSLAMADLKDVETKARMFAAHTIGQLEFDEERGCWRAPEAPAQSPVDDGLLAEEDLQEPHARVLRKLFAAALERALAEEPLRGRVPELRRCERPPALPAREGDEDVMEEMQGPYGPTVLLEHEGQVYLLAAGGLLLDPETQQFVGLWDAETKSVEPAPEGFDPSGGLTMVEHEGREYVMTADGGLFDAVTRQKAGVFNPDTQSVELAEPAEGVKLRMAWDEQLDDARSPGAYEEPADMEACLARADKYLERKSYRVAVREFQKALDACHRSSCVDVDEEVEILRKQALCFLGLRDYRKLLEGAEKILRLDDSDANALEWQNLASRELEKRRPVRY